MFCCLFLFVVAAVVGVVVLALVVVGVVVAVAAVVAAAAVVVFLASKTLSSKLHRPCTPKPKLSTIGPNIILAGSGREDHGYLPVLRCDRAGHI